MNFCSNCGNKLNTNVNFCSNCGCNFEKTTSNKIDESVEKVIKGIEGATKEVSNSQYLNKALTNSINSIGKGLIKIFAIISIVIFFIQFFNYFFLNKNIHLISAYQDIINKSNYNNGKLEIALIYFAQILPSTILPIIFIYLYSKRVNWVSYLLGIIIVLLVSSTLIRKEHIIYGLDNSAKKENNTIVENPTSINYTSDENLTLNNNKDLNTNENNIFKYLEGNFVFQNHEFKYEFKCKDDVWGETKLKILKDNLLYYTNENTTYNCAIYNIEQNNGYFCYEIHSAGGTSGMESYTYHLLNLRNKQVFELEKYYPIDEEENYTLFGLDEIKKNPEVYSILKIKLEK